MSAETKPISEEEAQKWSQAWERLTRLGDEDAWGRGDDAWRRKELAFSLRLLAEHEEMKALLDLERLAALEHEQWNYWTQAVAPEVSKERRRLWESYWVPYEWLTEEVKEYDRGWARKVRGEEQP